MTDNMQKIFRPIPKSDLFLDPSILWLKKWHTDPPTEEMEQPI